MVFALIVGHGGLGLLALVASFLPERGRRRALVAFSVLGVGGGVAIAVLGVTGESWRSLDLGPEAVVAGAASSVGWMVAAATVAKRGRSVACALVGVTSCSLIVAATSRWLVPMLLFWICSTLALAVLAGTSGRAGPVWAALFLSDALLVGALFWNWIDERVWQLPLALDGWPRYLVLASAAVRAGAVPAVGVWGALRGTSAPVAPLLAGGAFLMLPIALGPAEPWTASALFAVAVLGAGGALWKGRALLPAAGSVTPALLLGSTMVAPQGLVAAGLAAVLAGGAIALWDPQSEHGSAERSLALATLPPWIGFSAVVLAASTAVARVTSAEDVIDKVPWSLVVVLLPAALAAAVVVAARCALTSPPSSSWWAGFKRMDDGAVATFVTRLILVAGIAGGMTPGEWLGLEGGFFDWSARRTILFGAALVLGVGAAWWPGRRLASDRELARVDLSWAVVEPRAASVAGRILLGLSLLLAVASIAVVAWFTFEGLRLGFL